MLIGRACSGASASVLRMQSTAFSRPEESLVLASAHGYPGSPYVAEQMRRPPAPSGGAPRQDVSVAADIGAS